MVSTGLLGVLFAIVGFAAMFLMYHLWGYPFDKASRTSAAPRWAMRTHRALGYLFVALYVGLMWHMLPRLWEYQVEFAARTVVHIVLGFTIGFLLLIKIAIMRFFRHFEDWMPYLGTAIMLGTVVLLGLSLPYFFHERSLAASAPGGGVTSAASLRRVATQLAQAELPPSASVAKLATADAMNRGRMVLLDQCVKCHDLRTILAKPRSPAGWWSTVERMADKPALFSPMSEQDLWYATAYLVAITPDLQRSAKRKRTEQNAQADEVSHSEDNPDGATDAADGDDVAVRAAPEPPGEPGPAAAPAPDVEIKASAVTKPAAVRPAAAPAMDMAKAKASYERVCSQCHELSDVDADPPRSTSEARSLVLRMIKENDAKMSRTEIRLVTAWLIAHFVNKAP